MVRSLKNSKECVYQRAKHGDQDKYLMYKECFFTIDRYGSWGVCYTYATWFALGGLAVTGKTYDNCLAMREGVDFLLKKQNSNGGWGESYMSCSEKVMLLL